MSELYGTIFVHCPYLRLLGKNTMVAAASDFTRSNYPTSE